MEPSRVNFPTAQTYTSDGNSKLNLEQEAKGVYNVVLANKKKSYSGKIVFE